MTVLHHPGGVGIAAHGDRYGLQAVAVDVNRYGLTLVVPVPDTRDVGWSQHNVVTVMVAGTVCRYVNTARLAVKLGGDNEACQAVYLWCVDQLRQNYGRYQHSCVAMAASGTS